MIAPGEEEEGKEECEGDNCDEEGGGGGSADDDMAAEYYPQGQYMMPPGVGGYGQPMMSRAMQQQMFQQSMQGPNMMGSILPAPGMGYQGAAGYGPRRAGSRHSLQAMPRPGYTQKQLQGRGAGSRHSVHGMPRAQQQGQTGGSNRYSIANGK